MTYSCTVRGDLIDIIKKLFKRKVKFDAILIETTGLADPAPVAQTFFVDDNVREKCRLDAIITVVDAKHIIQHLDDEKPDGVENGKVAIPKKNKTPSSINFCLFALDVKWTYFLIPGRTFLPHRVRRTGTSLSWDIISVTYMFICLALLGSNT